MKTTYARRMAQVTLEGIGQQDVNEGDDIVVRATVSLPAKDFGEWTEIRPDLQFDARVLDAWGERLHARWGHSKPNEDAIRYRTQAFHAPTWKEARALAKAWVDEGCNALFAALDAREQALKDAGEWEE